MRNLLATMIVFVLASSTASANGYYNVDTRLIEVGSRYSYWSWVATIDGYDNDVQCTARAMLLDRSGFILKQQSRSYQLAAHDTMTLRGKMMLKNDTSSRVHSITVDGRCR